MATCFEQHLKDVLSQEEKRDFAAIARAEASKYNLETPDVFSYKNAAGQQLKQLTDEEFKITSGFSNSFKSAVETPANERVKLADHVKQSIPTFINTGVDLFTFITKSNKDEVRARFAKFLDKDEVSEKEQLTIDNFIDFIKTQVSKSFAQDWFLPTNLTGKDNKSLTKDVSDKYLSADLMTQLTYVDKGKRYTTEAVKTALGYAAYQALFDLEESTYYKDADDIKIIHGKAPVAHLGKVLKDLENKHLPTGTAMNNWGQVAFTALGLSEAKDASPNIAANLKVALGAQVAQILRDRNILEVKSILGNDYHYLFNEKEVPYVGPTTRYFYTVNKTYNTDVNTVTNVKKLIETAIEVKKQSGDVVSKIFTGSNNTKDILYKPSKTITTKTKTGMSVPLLMQQAQEAVQNNPLIAEPTQALLMLDMAESKATDDLTFAEVLVGVKTQEQISQAHHTQRKGLEAANDSLRKGLDVLLQHYNDASEAATETGKELPVYLKMDVWKMLRAGTSYGAIDPTGQKIHRYSMIAPGWVKEVKFGSEQESDFLRRVAEGLNTETDKQSNEVTDKQLKEKLNTPSIQTAIKAIQTGENYGAIITALDQVNLKGGERVKTFSALVAYANYLTAQEKKQTSFEASLMGEVDGVSNGPMLTLLMLGTTVGFLPMEELFAKGGFYTNETKDFNVWIKQGNTDLYNHASQFVLVGIADWARKNNGEFLKGLEYFSGTEVNNVIELTTRKSIKEAVNPIMFGSALSRAVKGLFDKFVDGIYTKIAFVYNMEESESKQEAVKELNQKLISLGLIKSAQSIDELHNVFEITPQQYEGMWGVYYFNKGSIGSVIQNSLDTYFKDFFEVKTLITKTSNAAAENYIAAKKVLTNRALEEAGITYTDDSVNVGLSQEALDKIEKQLMDAGLTPVVHSIWSQEEKDLNSGLLLLKRHKGQTDDDQYMTKVTGAHPFVGGYNKHLTARSKGPVEAGPGVLATSVPTHAFDGYVSFTRMLELFKEGITSFNMHDSGGTSFSDMKKMAIEFNKVTFRGLIKYSPATAIAEMTVRNLEAVAAFGIVLVDDLQEQIVIAKDLVYTAKQATENKLSFLKKVTNVSQYAYEGGSYAVTNADLEEINQQEEDENDRHNKLLARLDKITVKASTTVAVVKPKTNNKLNVWFSTNENAELSNLAERKFTLDNKKYFSVEHAYQVWKGGSFDESTYKKYTKGGVKIIGKKAKTENNWNIRLMKRIMLESFKQNKVAKDLLLATKNSEITHTQDKGVWATEFPRLLMEVRSELQNPTVLEDTATTPEEAEAQTDVPAEEQPTDLVDEAATVIYRSTQSVDASFSKYVTKEKYPLLANAFKYGFSVYDVEDGTSLSEFLDSVQTSLEEYYAENPEAHGINYFKYHNRKDRDSAMNREIASYTEKLNAEIKDLKLNALKNINIKTTETTVNVITAKLDELFKTKDSISLDTFLGFVSNSSYAAYGELAKVLKGSNAQVRVIDSLEDLDKETKTELTKLGSFSGAMYKNIIYIHKDALIKQSYMHANFVEEMLLHEAVHAVVSGFMLTEEGKATETYKNLVELYSVAKTAAKEQNKEFVRELENIDEFVTYALTSKEFQVFLNTLTISKNSAEVKKYYTRNVFLNFVQKVAEIFNIALNKTKDEKTLNNVLFAVITQGAVLIDLAKKDQQASTQARGMKLPNGLYTHRTMDVFDALNTSLDQETTNHLRSLLSTVVYKLHGPFGSLQAKYMENVALDAVRTYQSVPANELPIATAIATASLPVTDAEAFAVDQIAIALEGGLKNPAMRKYSRVLEKLYEQAQKELKPTDFSKGVYDFIFDTSNTQGQALIRFAALGLANKQVMEAYKKVNVVLPEVKVKNTLFSRLQWVFTQVINFVSSKTTGVLQQETLDVNLDRILKNLVASEAKYQAISNVPNVTNVINKYTNLALEKVGAGITSVVRSNAVLNSPVARIPKVGYAAAKTLRIGGKLVDWSINGKFETFIKGSLKARNRTINGPFGFKAGVVNEVLGETDINQSFFRMLQLVKQTESVRETLIQRTSTTILELFENNGKDITEEQSKGLSNLLRTGIGISGFTGQQVQEFLTDGSKLDKEIDAVIARIKPIAGKHTKFIAAKAEATGDWLNTGVSKDPTRIAVNATMVIQMQGTPIEGALNKQKAALLPEVETLISLFALRHLDKTAVLPLINKEVVRGPDNGVDFILRRHLDLHNEAKESLFKNKEIFMQHGYLPEVVNPNVDVVYATATPGKPLEENVLLYQQAGYVSYGMLGKDPAHTVPTVMLVNKNVPATRRLTALLAVIDENTKGTLLHDGVNNGPLGIANQVMNGRVNKVTELNYAKWERKGFAFNPDYENTLMVPLVNEQGTLVNARYMANADFRNNVLQRNNNFAYLLGKYHGTTYEKLNSKEQNKTIVQATKDLFDVNYKKHERDYLFVGLTSNNQEYKDAYKLLPEATRQEVKRVWGTEGMFVRKDMLDLVFGYRKLTVGDAMLKSKAEQNAIIKHMNQLAVYIYARKGAADEQKAATLKAAIFMKRLQRGTEEVVTELKKSIVMRLPTVLFGNETSNMSLLKLKGMGIYEALQEKSKALNALNVYRTQSEELDKLNTYLRTGTRINEHPAFIKRIGWLEESMNNNPVKVLIDAGFMPTIVEDVETIAEDYSYKGELFNKIEQKANKYKIGRGTLEASNQLFMGEDTGLFQFMRYATQASDFTARYALYVHLSKDKTRTKEEIFSEISQSFVNYDIPSHRMMEALNSVGLLMFTKFVLRVQKPLLEAVKANPSNAMMLWLFDYFFSGLNMVTEASFVNRFYNPLNLGPLEYPFILDDIATISSITGTAGSLVPGE